MRREGYDREDTDFPPSRIRRRVSGAPSEGNLRLLPSLYKRHISRRKGLGY